MATANCTKIKTKSVLFVALLLSSLLGAVLWMHSDLPPYSFPDYDLNTNYWGIIVDVAHKWRDLNFNFWDRGIAGGYSPYASGQYPILNFFNIAAFVLNDDSFFLFNLILPHVLGFFFTFLLFAKIFDLQWPYALFGALLYMSVPLGKHVNLAQQPIFFWGTALFPAMIYAFLKLKNKNIYLAAATVGSLIAFQFATGGGVQLPLVVIWWSLFWFIHLLCPSQKDTTRSNIKTWTLSYPLLLIMAIGLFGIQLIPTLEFAAREATRLNSYPINNFPIFANELTKLKFMHEYSLLDILWHFLWDAGITSKGILCVIVLSIALFFRAPKKNFHSFKHKKFLSTTWAATIGCFLLPASAELLSSLIPSFIKLFSFLTMFTFKYGVYLLDFSIALTSCLILNNEFRPRNKKVTTLFVIVLLCLGFKNFINSYDWDSKAKRVAVAAFRSDAPEIQYFRSSRKKYLLPYDHSPLMSSNYVLNYGVNGVGGLFSLPTTRFNKFVSHYHRTPKDSLTSRSHTYNYFILQPSESLAALFPVDFTTIRHGDNLPWSNFVLKISGEQYDIWERKDEIKHVRFAGSIKCMLFPELIKQLDLPSSSNLFFADIEDCERFHIKTTLSPRKPKSRPHYSKFVQRGDVVSFNVFTPQETSVMLSEMYQKGWKALANGKKIEIFPANYLFIGFRLPPGNHFIELKFTPPLLHLGLLITIAALIFLGILIMSRFEKMGGTGETGD